MRRGRGFTLIELLVVVAIIALLIGDSFAQSRQGPRKGQDHQMPHERPRHRAGVLRVHVRLLAPPSVLLLAAATGPASWRRMAPATRSASVPTAIGPNPSNSASVQGSASLPWANFGAGTDSGAYGMNGWLLQGGDTSDLQNNAINNNAGSPPGTFWNYPFVRMNSQIPMIGDSCWPNGWPLADNQPPATVQDLANGVGSVNGQMMRRWCISRHAKTINMAFADAHAENIILKNLWTLNWHASWVTPSVLPTIP